MSKFDLLFEKAKATPRRILLPESLDKRTLEAAVTSKAAGIAIPVLVGNPNDIKRAGQSFNIDLSDIDIIDQGQPSLQSHLTHIMIEKRAPKPVGDQEIECALHDSVSAACLLLSDGQGDGCVAGAITPTTNVIRSALRYVGTAENVSLVSSFFAMRMSDHHPVTDLMLMGDCGLMVDPNASELAQIAEATGNSAEKLFNLTPQIAMLSFSTNASARHSSVTKVREATAIVKEQKPQWRVLGDVQLDAAVIPDILASKYPEQASDTPCNTLIFPNLDAGNIGYKLVERFGGAQAVGPILQGLAKPVNDLSRGCSSDDIVNLIAVTAAQV